MKKSEFLDKVSSAFLARNHCWSLVHADKRAYQYNLGLDVSQKVLLVISFSCRPDNMRVHHSVGWSPSREALLEYLRGTDWTPKPRDGVLRRLLTLERPRDFEHDRMSTPVTSLIKPVGGFDLSKDAPDEIIAKMLEEIFEYAFPYLCMMLKARHGIDMMPVQLGESA